MAITNVVVARQCIVDRESAVVGYEFLTRPVPAEHFVEPKADDDLMSASALLRWQTSGLDELVGSKDLFVDADHDVLTGAVAVGMPSSRAVIQVPSDHEVDRRAVDVCAKLSREGYRIAVDHGVECKDLPALLRVASVLRVDVSKVDILAVREALDARGHYHLQLLAENVDTHELLQQYRRTGFDLFQGRAVGVAHELRDSVPQSQLAVVRLAASLLGSDFDVDEIENILRTEPSMTYQLLRLAGIGARDGMRREVRTLRDALVLVGATRVRSWVALLLLRPVSTGSDEAMVSALYRARMCELLAHSLSPKQAPLAFTAGVLSAFDQLLGLSVDTIVKTLPLDEALREAAFGGDSEVGQLVSDVIDYQSGSINGPHRSVLLDRDFDVASMKAIRWAEASMTEMNSPTLALA